MVRKITIFLTIVLLGMAGFAQQRTDSVHVAHYDLNLSVVDFAGHTIDGYTDITVVSKVNNLTQVRLDLKAPSPEFPSMTGALRDYLKNQQ